MSNVLVFAPHNDDEVLGVGGTIRKLADRGDTITVCEVTSGPDIDKVELIKNEARLAHKILGVYRSIFLDLPVIELKHVSTQVLNQKLLEVVKTVNPNLVFIPHRGDMHIDHYEVAMSAMVALRPIENPELKTVLAYETLSESEWNIPSSDNLFIPNCWSDISNTLETKIIAMDAYKTQIRNFPHPRSIQGIKALAMYRGSTIGVCAAEAFTVIRNLI